MRGAWVEMHGVRAAQNVAKSLPVRGAWVEIVQSVCLYWFLSVAPRAGSVG